ncbi:hypothetical protein JL475_06420 [Streptomyces sp. M2CJ-2]|uniref:hypothetical protein n=1 Tax=Streptomyces sp. M2CJ-2 TaxID=2803948 RepID=UPI001922EAD8|nr:hypothetical protein [Streptomyces sp. M2CJ-2]MBL3665641.1 hypothetical protein [Streptomyces sp. M2CJ-2]
MSNRNFGEVVQGPMTPDGPSVEDLRAEMHGGQVAGRFRYRDERGPQDAAVIRGESVAGDGAVTEAQMAEIRKAAGIGADHRHAAHAAKSFSDRRDPVTGGVIRTWEDGRTELVDETRPASRG